MIDRRSFFTTAVGAAAWLAGRKPAGHAVAIEAPLPEAVVARTVDRSRRLRIDEEIDRRIETFNTASLLPRKSGYDPDVLIVDHIQVRCRVSDELIADSDLDVRAEVERRLAEALFQKIDSAWGVVAGNGEVAEVYPASVWRGEISQTTTLARGALRLKLKPNQPYHPPHGHVLRPIGWQGGFHNIAFGSSFRCT